MTQTSKPIIKTTNKGVMTALSAFIIWGLFPLYFKELAAYDPVEIIGHRVIWTFFCLLIVIVVTKRFDWITQFKKNPKWIVYTILGGVIITTNWLTYVWAVNNDHLLEASLGYFMSPLVGVGLSMIFLKERLRKLQLVAVGIATSAVLIQLVMLGKLPMVSLILSLSFAVYGMIQRATPLMAVDALFIETTVMAPVAVIWFYYAGVASSDLSFWFSSNILLLICAGPITLIPLLLFNKSTKMVAFSILSFMNYLTPSFVFLLAVFYYHEPFDMQKLTVFAVIWMALLLFSIDLWNHRPAKINKMT